ncbi:hypothetical protein [Mangrovibacter yixingensis]|uniref:hypothetical protein n=1 Tax=Mangrovibacter yixingensis TaxID=1529639 RepID=UPI001CFB0F3E|nr:hypothetical protein [Mangrovibacter yixingensis]
MFCSTKLSQQNSAITTRDHAAHLVIIWYSGLFLAVIKTIYLFQLPAKLTIQQTAMMVIRCFRGLQHHDG